MALCIGSSQLAAVSLGTLWVATWLRDVAGHTQAEVAQVLLAFNLAMIAGYLGFGRIADGMTRRGRSTLPLLFAGVAAASICLGLIVLGCAPAPSRCGAVFRLSTVCFRTRFFRGAIRKRWSAA
jgi:predicted MFS family arabinose efflux permease